MTASLAPAVERALQGRDRGGDGPVHVGEGGGGHAGGEGGGVELVVGVQHEGHVHGPRGRGGGPLPAEHVEEVRGVGEARVGSDGGQAPAQAIDRGHHAWPSAR